MSFPIEASRPQKENLTNLTKEKVNSSQNKTSSINRGQIWPTCLMCKKPLPREIKVVNIHHQSCPWRYYIECESCGYQNNLSKLLGFWQGCSTQCQEEHLMFKLRDKNLNLFKQVERRT